MFFRSAPKRPEQVLQDCIEAIVLCNNQVHDKAIAAVEAVTKKLARLIAGYPDKKDKEIMEGLSAGLERLENLIAVEEGTEKKLWKDPSARWTSDLNELAVLDHELLREAAKLVGIVEGKTWEEIVADKQQQGLTYQQQLANFVQRCRELREKGELKGYSERTPAWWASETNINYVKKMAAELKQPAEQALALMEVIFRLDYLLRLLRKTTDFNVPNLAASLQAIGVWQPWRAMSYFEVEIGGRTRRVRVWSISKLRSRLTALQRVWGRLGPPPR